MRRVLLTITILMMLNPYASAQLERRIPVLRAQFPDSECTMTEEQVSAMIARAGEYFTNQYQGTQQFIFDLGPVVTLGESEEYYGRNSTDRKDALLYKAVQETCWASDALMDFRLYDSNSDNIVDNICILFAGNSESGADSPDLIWSQQGNLSNFDACITLDGKRIDCFCVSAEADSLGTFCHEYAHTLGLPDFYDTDGEGSGGRSKALWGSISLMDNGLKNNGGSTPPNLCCVELEMLGLGSPEELGMGEYTLPPIGREQRYLKSGTSNDGEYFLIECRDNSGWDEHIGGNGLLIYHIDKSHRNAGYSDYYRIPLTAWERWRRGQINCRPDHPCAALLAANPEADDVQGAFFPQDGHRSFGSDTEPAFRAWDGEESNLAIAGITRNADGSVSFSVVEPVMMGEVLSFQDAAIISWETNEAIGAVTESMISWSSPDGQADTLTVTGNVRCCTIEHLSPGTFYSAEVQVRCHGNEAFSASVQFRTKIWRKELQPYIYLGSAERGEQGGFLRGGRIPLRVYNIPDAAEVRWTLDGQKITVGPDGYYVLNRSGLLKAEVLHEDGSTDILIKRLTVE